MKMLSSLAQLVVMSLLLCTSVYASGCLTGDCDNGKGIMMFPDGTEYSGDFKNGQPNGIGTFIYSSGKVLEKEGLHDSAKEADLGKKINFGDGVGVKNQKWSHGYPMGKRYVGEVKNGKRNGYGVLEYEEPEHYYKGNFKEDMFNGRGFLKTEANGLIYEGDFVDHKPNGIGKVTFPDGRIYEGGIKGNKLHGKGVMTYPDGRRIEGQSEDGKFKAAAENAIYGGNG